MIRRFIGMLLIVGLILGGIFGWKAFGSYQARQGMAAMVMPPVTVSTAEAVAARWVPTIPAVGTLRAVQGVNVTPQLAGLITELNFDSGMTVAAGTLLARQYTADDEARLAGLVADTRLAQINVKRAEDLKNKGLLADLDLDIRRNDLQRTRAAEDNLRLVIEQKSIRAPFSGRLGIREVDIGQYVEPGDTIVRLEAVAQLLVEFPVPQRHLGELRTGQAIKLMTDAWPGAQFAGQIRAIEPQVARATRMIQVQGVIDNADERLVPGMFVEVAIELPARDNVVTVPQAAVTYSPYGDSVFLLADEPGDDDAAGMAVRNSFVITGATRGDQVAIESGLSPGDIVVTAGQQKLRNNARVRVDNSVSVSNAADPRLENN